MTKNDGSSKATMDGKQFTSLSKYLPEWLNRYDVYAEPTDCIKIWTQHYIMYQIRFK